MVETSLVIEVIPEDVQTVVVTVENEADVGLFSSSGVCGTCFGRLLRR